MNFVLQNWYLIKLYSYKKTQYQTNKFSNQDI